ncbi:MarR family transcriptional regulator [Butyricicoccus faecihominis]|uniref:MarR family winged helix-turn-helix transcriptional regulator n=1 Tax=Butyricicoccaceae TaxID=3085642 RepID=UPI002479874D|nr:MarR family transcriptional regulator [Agathobaculum sp. NTUH-O15-33]MCQ5128975.1 MarR family transcriptional regulator [Butyricicoccus faecihominis]WNX85547.1 MarR family transcriptional regulator [Agathobaculum sp. NTUH-O15-33]
MKQRIGAELGMLNNLIKRQMACMMAGSDIDCITGMQSMVLHYLIQSEGQGDRFQKDIETQFAMRRSTATGILQLMEQHGLVRREQSAHDARLKRLVLTDKARALNQEIHQGLEATEALMQRGVTQEELEIWFAVCEKIRVNLEQYQREASEETKYDQTTGKMRARVQEGRAAHPVFRHTRGRDGGGHTDGDGAPDRPRHRRG